MLEFDHELQNYFSQIKSTIDEIINNNININLSQISKENTIIFVIDMLKGFCYKNKGPLADEQIGKIIKPTQILLNKAKKLQIPIIAINDAHNTKAPEFANYPDHCVKGSEEAEMVTELSHLVTKIITKNSTNGFLANNFCKNEKWKNIIVVGCCTDICIFQFALSCKTFFNENNLPVNVYVPITMTETFDLNYQQQSTIEKHNKELAKKIHPSRIINYLFYYFMLTNGINIIYDIT